MSRALRARRLTGDRGAVIPLVALSLVFLMAGTALSVDIGRLSHRRRDLQSVADAVALDAARRIDGRTTAELDPVVDDAAAASAARNEFLLDGDDQLDAVLGTWDISAGTFTPTSAGEVPNAVRVVARDTVAFYFHAGERATERVGTAMRLLPTLPCVITCGAQQGFGSVAGFELASFLAAFHADLPSSVELDERREIKTRWLNAVLGVSFGSTLPGGQLDLTAVSYQGLASGWVTLGDLQAALGFGSIDQLLTTDVTLGELLDAFLAVMNDEGNLAAYSALDQIRGEIDSSLTLPLGETIRVVQGAEGSAAGATFNLLDLVGGAATLINGQNLTRTTVDTAIPNPLTPAADTLLATLDLVVLEPPAFAYGPAALDDNGRWLTTARNTQVQLQVTLEVPGLTLDVLPPAVPGGPALPSLVTVQVPIVLMGADAVADLTRISCGSVQDDTTTQVDTFTRALDAYIGLASDLTAANTPVGPAPLFTVAGTPVQGYASAVVGGGSDSLFFPVPGVPWGSAANRQTAAGGTDTDVTGQLLTNLSAGITGLGATVTQSLVNQLEVVLADLDTLLLEPLAEATGLTLGGATVLAKTAPDCAVPILVD